MQVNLFHNLKYLYLTCSMKYFHGGFNKNLTTCNFTNMNKCVLCCVSTHLCVFCTCPCLCEFMSHHKIILLVLTSNSVNVVNSSFKTSHFSQSV